ncbi:uncharacterized protein LOC121399866 isoform X2 [Xenopus laevis]|uniref:Uncharacterized protein LOC121399866 isoform X2 n=1 Tax=Xenopus laevis TaxID=8355 RepID=A0A8J1M8I2_XENLA|nr:uncharacterized protein LOC121399866 isoform X2 [Xenopus laevis]
MSHIDLCEVRNWLTANMDRTKEREMDMDGLYQDLLDRPSSVFFDKHDKKLCPKVCCQVEAQRRNSVWISADLSPWILRTTGFIQSWEKEALAG